MTVEARSGDWMLTHTGREFYPLDPRVEDVDPLDIAHALSLLCRYNGHVRKFYSVAEHCVLMSEAVAPQHALWALLHDAAEAYVGDMIRPLKRFMPDYRVAEDRVMLAIAQRFHLVSPKLDVAEGLRVMRMPDPVKDADSRILMTERAALLTPSATPWGGGLEELEPLPVKVSGWHPQDAEATYLQRLGELWSETPW